jgi:uncharacterized Zn finger protein (UPF0148 family)
MNRKETIKDLKKHFKTVVSCKKCNTPYGLDTKKDNGICPICEDTQVKKTKAENKKKNIKK